MLPDKYVIEKPERFYEKTRFHPKTHDTCIIILNYNNKASILKLAGYLRDVDADVLMVDNHSGDGSFDALYAEYADRYNLIRTRENLGGAGGFGLGIQWVVERGYDYCFVSEEDALPVSGDEDIFVEMLKYRAPDRFVVARYFELDVNSFNLHYTIYPSWLIKEAGTLNMGLFFRADDQEWGERVRRRARQSGRQMETVRVARSYTHPLIKKGFGLFANYFSMRNAFLVYLKYPNRHFLVDYTFNFVKYFSYGLFCLLYDGNPWPMRQFAVAYLDFLKEDLTHNKERIATLGQALLEPKQTYRMQTCDFDTFYRRFADRKIVSDSMRNPHFLVYRFASSAKKGVIAGKYSGVSRLKALWFRRIVFVEHVDFMQRRIEYFEYENRGWLWARALLLFSTALGAIGAGVTWPVTFVKRWRG